jgi:hypothetical protein
MSFGVKGLGWLADYCPMDNFSSESIGGERLIVDGDYATTQNLVTERLMGYRNKSQFQHKYQLKKY